MSKDFFTFSDQKSQKSKSTTSPQPRHWPAPQIKVKFMHRGLLRGSSCQGFLRQFPGENPQWGECQFDFDVDCREYDWLVVYQDLPPEEGLFTEEILACPKEKTMLITGEPSTITVFGRDYLRQFGCILSFQEPWAMPHPNVIFHHPGLIWHYGLPFDGSEFQSWDYIAAMDIPQKNRTISTVCSQRTGKNTLHSARVEFTWKLKEELDELDIYGHGVRPMNDKAEALDPYFYHIAVENHVAPHHLTEKLPDAFLGYTLPFFHGAPNTDDYFPKESFIPIDINNYSYSRDVILSCMKNNEYSDRLPYIKEARRLVLEEQNLFAIISRNIDEQERQFRTTGVTAKITAGSVIRNRPTMRIKNPLAGVRSLWEKAAIKSWHRITAKKRQQPRKLE